jgi:hypothetical protein
LKLLFDYQSNYMNQSSIYTALENSQAFAPANAKMGGDSALDRMQGARPNAGG